MEDKHKHMPKMVSLLFLISVFGLVVIFDCGKKKTGYRQEKLVLLCGSSFVPPGKKMCSEFTASTGIAVVTTVAGSEDFLPLVKTGRKGDILITHDPYLDYASDANALAEHAQVGFVAPVLVVQEANPKSISSIDDLTKEGLKAAFTDPQYSTCGEMVFKLLEKKGIKEAVMKNVGNRLTKGHSTVGTFFETGVIDAAIMWNGVANTFADSLDIVPTPYEYDSEIRVHVIGLSYSQYPEHVKKLVEFARTRGKEIFAEHGYVK